MGKRLNKFSIHDHEIEVSDDNRTAELFCTGEDGTRSSLGKFTTQGEDLAQTQAIVAARDHKHAGIKPVKPEESKPCRPAKKERTNPAGKKPTAKK